MELQAAYWQKQFGALTAQAEEVHALSTKVTADTAEPIKVHVMNGMDVCVVQTDAWFPSYLHAAQSMLAGSPAGTPIQGDAP